MIWGLNVFEDILAAPSQVGSLYIPSDPSLPIVTPSVIPSLWVWAGPSDSLLTQRKRWDTTSKSSLQQDSSLLLPCFAHLTPFSPACSFWWKPASHHELLHRGKELREAFGPPPARNGDMLEPANTQMCEFGSGPPPSWALRWLLPRPALCLQLMRCLETEDLAKPHLDSWSPTTVR